MADLLHWLGSSRYSSLPDASESPVKNMGLKGMTSGLSALSTVSGDKHVRRHRHRDIGGYLLRSKCLLRHRLPLFKWLNILLSTWVLNVILGAGSRWLFVIASDDIAGIPAHYALMTKWFRSPHMVFWSGSTVTISQVLKPPIRICADWIAQHYKQTQCLAHKPSTATVLKLVTVTLLSLCNTRIEAVLARNKFLRTRLFI